MNAKAPTPVHIDLVSDVACPWCAVGLWALEGALQQLQGEVSATIQPQPFELNPNMGPEGEDIYEHLNRKYGRSREELTQVQQTIAERGNAVGFAFKAGGRGRIWNTFDAHRLLHWATVEGTPGQALALKKALLTAYQGRAENPSDPTVLLAAAVEVGLDADRARAVLQTGEFADAVREQEAEWAQLGIRSVPAFIVNRKHLISGGQPPEVFVQALRQIAAEG